MIEGPDQRDDATDVRQGRDSSGEVNPLSLEDTGPPAEVLDGHGKDEENNSATMDVPEPTVREQRCYNLRTTSRKHELQLGPVYD